jgi:hypothetical protein
MLVNLTATALRTERITEGSMPPSTHIEAVLVVRGDTPEGPIDGVLTVKLPEALGSRVWPGKVFDMTMKSSDTQPNSYANLKIDTDSEPEVPSDGE